MTDQGAGAGIIRILADAGQFIMELASLVGIGLIGWHAGRQGVLGTILAVGLILGVGSIWGRYRTPGFVPTGREPGHPVSGRIRIALELTVYVIGLLGMWWSGRENTASSLIVVMLLTLALSHQRLRALWNTHV